MLKSGFTFLVILLCALTLTAQTKKKSAKKPVKKAAAAKPAVETPVEAVTAPAKKNERADQEAASTGGVNSGSAGKANQRSTNVQSAQIVKYPYYYEFSQPAFEISKMVVEHDEAGIGRVTFLRRDYGEPVTDPLQLSAATMEKLKSLFTTLNFTASSEEYQSERDYSHMGTATIRLAQNGKEREAKYNWTENKDARALADEYRKIGDQAVWVFDITLARENQPLNAPQLIDAMDGMLRRNWISDPHQLKPFLMQLSDDERIPLLARNHAKKLVEQINKSKK
jgi:hypothetical protein